MSALMNRRRDKWASTLLSPALDFGVSHFLHLIGQLEVPKPKATQRSKSEISSFLLALIRTQSGQPLTGRPAGAYSGNELESATSPPCRHSSLRTWARVLRVLIDLNQ